MWAGGAFQLNGSNNLTLTDPIFKYCRINERKPYIGIYFRQLEETGKFLELRSSSICSSASTEQIRACLTAAPLLCRDWLVLLLGQCIKRLLAEVQTAFYLVKEETDNLQEPISTKKGSLDD